MKQSIRSILASELYNCKNYIERIFFILSLEDLYKETYFFETSKSLNDDLDDFIQNTILKLNSNSSLRGKSNKDKFTYSYRLIENIIELHPCEETLIQQVSQFINIILKHCFSFHKMLQSQSDLDIQYPRINFIEIISTDETTNIDGLYLNSKKFKNYKNQNIFVQNLKIQRDKSYEKFINQGHLNIYEQDFDKALSCFNKAQNYKNTAEILNLIGWSYFHLKDYEKAKSYSLKAIKKNPHYGPAYNDYGTYMLNEGHPEKSVKWFTIAKTCKYYQNREYPYINSGRAYILMKEYTKALDEFSIALTLAPHHEELHQTITKLKSSLLKTQPTSTSSTTSLSPIL